MTCTKCKLISCLHSYLLTSTFQKVIKRGVSKKFTYPSEGSAKWCLQDKVSLQSDDKKTKAYTICIDAVLI